MSVLTATRLRTYRQCPKKHLYRYVMGYAPVRTSEAFAFGTYVHERLEKWFRNMGQP